MLELIIQPVKLSAFTNPFFGLISYVFNQFESEDGTFKASMCWTVFTA